MVTKDIDSITYLLKQAKEKNKPKPIVFLGAGASASAGIPLTGKIISDILEKYKEKPEIRKLSDGDKKDYYKVMGSIETFERHELLRDYIENVDVKINVTHIYLAQMLKDGYIDYVVTVNFDDLLLKACALFNFIPAVYDIAILKDFTTTTLQKRSVTYLHGQYHGLWLLNTPDELNKVKAEGHDSVTNIFRQICNERAWIIAGYSGEDGILDKIANLGRFDNNLYWVGYKDNLPSKNVQDKLLNKPNSNAYWIKGYDSDCFFLKLHSELGLDTPEIFNKPFSFLNKVVNNIKDIEIDEEPNEEHKELLKQVEERFSTSKNWINDAIERYENKGGNGVLLDATQINKDDLKQDILEAIVKNQFDKADELYDKVKRYAPELNGQIADLYFNWGLSYSEKKDHQNAIECYKKVLIIKPNHEKALYNIGTEYLNQNENKDALEYFQKTININAKLDYAFNNMGVAYYCEKEYDKAIECYLKAISINAKKHESYYNMGNAWWKKNDDDKAMECYQKALSIKPDTYEILYQIAFLYNKKGEGTLSIEYYQRASDADPNAYEPFYQLGLLHGEKGENEKAIAFYQKGIDVNPDSNNAYINLGFALIKMGQIDKAEKYLRIALDLGDKKFSYMNLGHIYLCKKEEKLAVDNYKLSLAAFEDTDEFWKGMNDDLQYLEQYGITKEYYQNILEKIKQK